MTFYINIKSEKRPTDWVLQVQGKRPTTLTGNAMSDFVLFCSLELSHAFSGHHVENLPYEWLNVFLKVRKSQSASRVRIEVTESIIHSSYRLCPIPMGNFTPCKDKRREGQRAAREGYPAVRLGLVLPSLLVISFVPRPTGHFTPGLT